MSDLFKISIKGVLVVDKRYLLRKNERNEWELLGGKLEDTDESPENRLIQEFLEESGIAIKINRQLEPWLYEIGATNIIILPFDCDAIKIPDELYDQDGGTLHWFAEEDLKTLNMPQGYFSSIKGQIPSKSYSHVPNQNSTDRVSPGRTVYVRVTGPNGAHEGSLSHHQNPRQVAEELSKELGISGARLIYMSVIIEPKKLILDYVISN